MPTKALHGTQLNLCTHRSLVRVRIWTHLSLPLEPKAHLLLHTVSQGGMRSSVSCPLHFVADATEHRYTVPGKILVCQAQPSGSWVWWSLGIPLSFLCKTQWKIPSMIFIIRLLFIQIYLIKSKLRNMFSLLGRYVFFLLSVHKKKKCTICISLFVLASRMLRSKFLISCAVNRWLSLSLLIE